MVPDDASCLGSVDVLVGFQDQLYPYFDSAQDPSVSTSAVTSVQQVSVCIQEHSTQRADSDLPRFLS